MRLTPPNIPRASGEGGIMLRQASLTTVGGLKSSSDGATRVASSQLPDGEALSGGDGGSGLEAQHVQGNHLSEAFLAMNCMRLKGQLCDVQLTAGGQQLRAHRLVLAASSPYFHAMFNSDMCEKSKGEVVLHDISFMALQLLVEFAYTGEVVITEANVQGLLPAASLVQVGSVRDACCSFLLRQLHPSNCLGIRSFADTHACRDLLCKSHRYALHHFREVAHTDEFLMLPLSQVEDLISSDELNVSSEELVYEATVAWIKHDLSERQKYVGKLLQHCRLPLTRRDFLLSKVGEEPLVQSSEESKDLLIEAMRYHLMPERRSAMAGTRTSQRRPDGLRSYLFAVGGGSLFAIHSECEYYNPRTDRWCSFAPTIHRRSRAGITALNRMLYAIGGFDGTRDLSSVECYDPVRNAWSLLPGLGSRRSCLGVGSLRGLVYVAGGYDGASCLSSVEQFDPLVGTWTSLAGMEYRRRYCRLAVLEDCLYAVGGHDGASYQSSVERLDPREGRWRLLPSMHSRRNSCGVAILERSLYAVGGNDGSLCLNSAERFDLAANMWDHVSSMHSRRTTHEVVQADGFLYAVGGNDGSSSLNTVERYDPRHNKWMLVTAMMLRRSSVGAAVLDCPVLERSAQERSYSTSTASSEP
ncbi:kelch-like protein 17 isoform X2 [Ixodes scapularis]